MAVNGTQLKSMTRENNRDSFLAKLSLQFTIGGSAIECRGTERAALAVVAGLLHTGAGPSIAVICSTRRQAEELCNRSIGYGRSILGLEASKHTWFRTKAKSDYYFFSAEEQDSEVLQGHKFDFVVYALSR